MKRTLLIIGLVVTVCNLVFGQNPTPNAGFETWTQQGNYWNPTGWNNLNSQTAILGVFTCTRGTGADARTGTYGIKLTTKSVFTVTANGIASTATLVTTPPYGVTGGIPYTLRPDSITGWFKYTPANSNDSGFVQFVLLGSANDTVGFVKFNTPNTPVGTWTRFSRPINYLSLATPALSYWILSSSDGSNAVVNSSIVIDDLALVFNPGTSVSEPETVLPSLVSNMIFDVISISNPLAGASRFEIFDQTGRMVANYKLSDGMNSFSANQMVGGIYYYRFVSDDQNLLFSGKLIRY
jgi:hypothetical protein